MSTPAERDSTSPLIEAVVDLAEAWDDLIFDNAVHFSCREVDALVRVFLAAGLPHSALMWITAHAENPDEEEDDLHFEVDPAEYLTKMERS